MPRKTAYGRLVDHFHNHPQGRLHEMLFWNGLGLLLGGLTLLGYLRGWVSIPLALMAGVISLCIFLWGFLPQRKPKTPPPVKGRLRAERAAAVRASKEEGKRFKAAKRGER